MEKKICAYLFCLTFIAISSVVHGQAARSPSVEPMAEVDIQDSKVSNQANPGYDFTSEATPPTKSKMRVPANIVSKNQESATSYIGPLIFLIALPIGLWIVVSRKFAANSEDKKIDYYPKTQQFKPYTTDYQKSAEDDDIDYPKAS
jgi:hypothetical protein